MATDFAVLAFSAASVGFIHTVLGPDHYLPFIAIAKSSGWSFAKTMLVTITCGLGHIISTLFLGSLGILFGFALKNMELIESVRGDIAGWLLISFGLIYLIWGLKRAVKYKPHSHIHMHGGEPAHFHEHIHTHEHSHPHKAKSNIKITPWLLFVIFIFGPCEALIPLLMYPAAISDTFTLIMIVTVFGISTIATMTGIVMLSVYGLNTIKAPLYEKYSHAFTGMVIFLCGISITFLGL